MDLKATKLLEIFSAERLTNLRLLRAHDDDRMREEYAAVHVPMIQSWIRHSQKFLIGDVTQLPKFEDIDETILHLPYEDVFLQFGTLETSRHINVVPMALCSKDRTSMYQNQITKFEQERQPAEFRFLIRPFYLSKNESGGWDAMDSLYLILVGITLEDRKLLYTTSKMGYTMDENLLTHIPMYKEDAQHAASNAARFLTLLSCSNIGVQTVEAPKKLNKKRLEKKEIPFFQYKTLYIKPRKESAGRDGEDEFLDDKRTSPCFHWRRGHVRNLQNGKRIWINAMAVGDPELGIVSKNYVLKG